MKCSVGYSLLLFVTTSNLWLTLTKGDTNYAAIESREKERGKKLICEVKRILFSSIKHFIILGPKKWIKRLLYYIGIFKQSVLCFLKL